MERHPSFSSSPDRSFIQQRPDSVEREDYEQALQTLELENDLNGEQASQLERRFSDFILRAKGLETADLPDIQRIKLMEIIQDLENARRAAAQAQEASRNRVRGLQELFSHDT